MSEDLRTERSWPALLDLAPESAGIDLAAVRRNEKAPDLALAEIHVVARHEPTGMRRRIYDCAQARHADLGPQTDFTDDGLPVDPLWGALRADDPALTAVCRG